MIATRAQQRGLVGEVGKVGTDHSRGRGGNRVEIDVVGQGDVPGVDLQDLRAPAPVRRLHYDAAIEKNAA